MREELDVLWSALEDEAESGEFSEGRVYRRLDLEKETGIRLGVVLPGKVRELLVQVEESDTSHLSPPNWIGMGFETVTMDAPKPRTRHLRLFLEASEHRSVFSTVSADIVATLLDVERPTTRIAHLQGCLDRWTRFFQTYGFSGLSSPAQRGLFGELRWLERALDTEVDPLLAVESWKGCHRDYHDFELHGTVVEVKTTTTKEPRTVRIQNERQLDDQGFESMYLYVLSIHVARSGGQGLPELVAELRRTLRGHREARFKFENSLRDAGYLDVHANAYTESYLTKKEEVFHVGDGFPRIISPPSGVGDISYSLVLSACTHFEVPVEDAITTFAGGGSNGRSVGSL